MPPIPPVFSIGPGAEPSSHAIATTRRYRDPNRRPPGRQGGRDDEAVTLSVPAAIELAAGERLFSEGEASGCAYFVENGEIEVFVDRFGFLQRIGIVGENRIVGEMGVIDRAPRSASARALSPARVRVVHAFVLDDMLERADPGVRALLVTLLERLRGLIQES